MDPDTVIAERYRLIELLGRGSFGVTWAAEDLRTGGRVAVKQLDLRHVDDWKIVELFEREARVLAALDHAQIPNYVEFIASPDQHTSYLVQELAPGRSLEARLAAGERFDEARVRDIAEQFLDVLIYLSERLPPVVHRDLKPGNVIMADDGRCYLVDFGSVRGAVEASTTGGSTVAGTFGYMAPEQLHGEATPTSDLFGLGMTLVHLMTGASPAELERKRLKVDFRKHVRVSEALAAFVDRLIEPVPDDRFASPRTARSALAGVAIELSPAPPVGLSGDAIAAQVAHMKRQAEETARRHEALAQRRSEEVARTTKPRVTLSEDAEGFMLSVDPVPLSRRFLVQLPIFGFLMINPGFVFVGGFPFLGRFWPIFGDSLFARIVVWVVFMAGVSLAVARARGQRVHVRVAGEHFAVWTHDPARPLAIGPTDALRIHVNDPADNGYGDAMLSLGENSQHFKRLAGPDLARLCRAKAIVEDGA